CATSAEGQFQKKRIGLGAAGGDFLAGLLAGTPGPGGVGGGAPPAPRPKMGIRGCGGPGLASRPGCGGGPWVGGGGNAEGAGHDIMLGNVLVGGTTANLGKEGLAIDQ